MAYLNVRERRIEAKIAYVGGELVGKATNLDRLKQSTRDARIGKIESSTEQPDALTLAWQPIDRTLFRDCDVLVNLVAQRGGASSERYEEALRGVDGVVVVLDAHPSAQDRNRASFDTVRDVLARSDRSSVPIVVQVNKTDLPDALGADEVLSGLDAPTPRHVPAAATEGTGVVETLEAALEEVLSAMTAETSDAHPLGDLGPSTGPLPRGESDGGHPLLGALRQVLRDTMTEHALALEARLTARLEQTLGRIERRVTITEALAVELREQLDESVARSREESAAGAARLDALALAIDQRTRGDRLALEAAKDDLIAEVARAVETRTRAEHAHLEKVKDELTKSADARSRADRDHFATASAFVKRSVEVLTGRVEEADARELVAELGQVVAAAAERADHTASRVEATAAGLAAVAKRVEAVEGSVRQRTGVLEEGVRGVNEQSRESVQALRHELVDAFAGTDERIAQLHARVNEIVEELKKPKKGWFA